MKKPSLLILVITLFLTASCKKESGIGGDATISGKVFARHYNSTFTIKLSEYYVPDTYVYIIYGNNLSYAQRIKTTYRGDFEFKYLYEGEYTIYTYSIDSAAIVHHEIQPPDSAVVINVRIGKRKQNESIGDIIVFK